MRQANGAILLRNRQGFTIVELLVVMGLITIVISLLLPAIRRARAQAIFVECKTRLRSQLQAHSMYGLDFRDAKPPIIYTKWNQTTYMQWVTPSVRWYGQPVGQGILVDRGYLQLGMLMDPLDALAEDAENDLRMWRETDFSGSSYIYFWNHPDDVEWRADGSPALATYDRCWRKGRKAMIMDCNMDRGTPFVGVMPAEGWTAHPVVGRMNVGFGDGSVQSFHNEEIRLRAPGSMVQQLQWFDEAHRRY